VRAGPAIPVIAAGRWLAGVLLAGFLAAALLYLAPGASVDDANSIPRLPRTFARPFAGIGGSRQHAWILRRLPQFGRSRGSRSLPDLRYPCHPTHRRTLEADGLLRSPGLDCRLAPWPVFGVAFAPAGGGPRRHSLCSVQSWYVFRPACWPSSSFVSGLPVSGILAAAVYPRSSCISETCSTVPHGRHTVLLRARVASGRYACSCSIAPGRSGLKPSLSRESPYPRPSGRPSPPRPCAMSLDSASWPGRAPWRAISISWSR